MAQFEPYLSFNGNCAEAMRFYEKTLGGKIEMSMTYGEAPPMPGQPAPSGDAAKRIMHASMTLEGDRIMASDMPPGMPHKGDIATESVAGAGTRTPSSGSRGDLYSRRAWFAARTTPTASAHRASRTEPRRLPARTCTGVTCVRG